jgi:hypothetical protein
MMTIRTPWASPIPKAVDQVSVKSPVIANMALLTQYPYV